MKQITRVNHLGIRVSNLETARSFYYKLGFEFIAGPVGPEPVAIMEHPSGVNINFILNADEPAKENILIDVPVKYAGYTHVALEVDDAQAVVAQLNDLDVEITEGPIEFPTGISIFIRDQDRNVIEFHQAKT